MAVLREISCIYTIKEVDDDIINQTLDSPEKVYQVFKHLKHQTKEQFIVVNLNNKHQIMNYEIVATGTVNQLSLRTAEILRSAIMINSPAIILVHNHPSGDPAPSHTDIQLTESVTAVDKTTEY